MSLEKWKVTLIIALLLFGISAYVTYGVPKISYAQVISDLSALPTAESVNIEAGNFSTVQGHLELTIATPENKYLLNATVTIDTDDPQATFDIFSDIDVVVKGSQDNVTIILPPAYSGSLSLDVLITFSNTTVQHPVTISVVDNFSGLSNSTTVYATP